MWNNADMTGGMTTVGEGLWHWFGGFHGGLSLIFLALIVAGVVLIVRDLRGGDPTSRQ